MMPPRCVAGAVFSVLIACQLAALSTALPSVGPPISLPAHRAAGSLRASLLKAESRIPSPAAGFLQTRLRGGDGEPGGHGHSHGHGHDHGHGGHGSHGGHGHAHGHGATSPVNGPRAFLDAVAFIQEMSDKNPKSSALIATAIVSCSSLIAMPLMPFLKDIDAGNGAPGGGSALLKILISFAVGGLLGDVFLHMLPHSVVKMAAKQSHDHVGDALNLGLPILTGMLLFYVAEQAMTALTGGGHSHSHHDAHGGAGDGHASGGHMHLIPCQGGKKQVGECANQHKACCQSAPANVQRRSMKEWLANAGQTIVEDICGRCRALKTMAQKGAKPAAYLNLLADIMHNFTDGLALGVSFGKGHGVSTTLAVFFHEVPHNIADFAILIQNGFSHSSALKAQFVSAIGAFLGCLAGFMLKDMSGIQGFVAGGFIYIATVDIIPVMLQDSGFGWPLIFEILAMTLGVAMNVLMLEIENSTGSCAH